MWKLVWDDGLEKFLCIAIAKLLPYRMMFIGIGRIRCG